MEISVIYKNGAFYAHLSPRLSNDKAIQSEMKKSGWKFNNRDGWFTTNIMSAAFLREHADEKVKKIFERAFIRFSPWEGALSVPKGLTLLPFQPGSALYALNRNRSCLALSPGLGKTIVAAIIAASMRVKTLIVCPPFLVLNTLEEFQKWAPKLHTRILNNVDWIVPDVLIVPDSQITNPYVRSYILMFQPELFIGDEWHRFKTDTAQRSKAVYGYRDNRKKVKYTPGILDGKHLKKIVLMSGTIMPNRPMELFPLLKKCAGQYINFMNKNSFGMKYCAGFPVKSEWTGQVFGYDFTGCDEKAFRRLMRQVKSPVTIHEDKTISAGESGFMLRLNKSILGLPPLTEEIVILGDEMPRSLKSMNAELLKQYSPKDLIKLEIKRLMGKSNSQEDVHLMTYRRLLGEYKVKPSCEYIESILEETEENLLVVALHKEVIRATAERLQKYDPLIITGDTPTMKRQKIVKEYQTNKKRRIILGNIDAIGVGFTLTKANRVLLIEYLYSPGGNRQVIDRAHRYGVEHELLAQYLCFRNSLDRSTIETLLFKEKITAYV